MSATTEQLAGREGAIRALAENPATPNQGDLCFLVAVLDAERLRIEQLKHENRELLETRGDLERQLQSPPNPWNTSEPPKDGTTIIAVGRVIWSDDISTCADSFVAAVRWIKDQSNYEGWHFDRDGMTVARTLDDEVMVDWWAHFPKEERR